MPVKRKRIVSDTKASNEDADALKYALTAATDEDRAKWTGFVDIDSDPALFTVMLEEWGVKGIKVREVYSLEEEGLMFLPRPVHGLIFLFRYRADDINKQEASCPDHVWYANQLHDKACATVALLNIVNNVPQADLGDNLAAFKEFSRDLTPVQRGHAIGSFDFVRKVHNSFARKMDILDTNLCLENQYDDRNKPKAKPSRKGKKNKLVEDDFISDDAAFHFIAFVPILDEVWKLDGLDRQPAKLGTISDDDWLSLVLPDLSARMAQYEESQIEFSILAVVADPLETYKAQLKHVRNSLHAVEGKLDDVKVDWREYVDSNGDQGRLSQLDTPEEQDSLSTETRARLKTNDSTQLLSYRQQLINECSAVKASVRDEEHSQQMDREKAWERRHDYGPAIHKWLRLLAEKDGVIKELVEEIR